VVDAGGQGLVWILRGMEEAWANRGTVIRLPQTASEPGTFEPEPAPQAVEFELTPDIAAIPFPYDTELFLRGKSLPMDTLRTELNQLGDSVLVVGSETLVKIHVHTDHPEQVLALVLKYGEPYDIVIKNMRIQHEELAAASSRKEEPAAVAAEEPQPMPAEDQAPTLAVVAVANGEGFHELFLSLGASGVVRGGQTMNPSTRDIVEAVEATGAASVIVLPNNSNVILACEQARRLTDVEVLVVPTRSMPEGVIALLALRPGEEPAENLRRMTDALMNVVTGEVTYAVAKRRSTALT